MFISQERSYTFFSGGTKVYYQPLFSILTLQQNILELV